MRNPGRLFGRCNTDTDCGDGARCLTNNSGWPGGFCTRPCTRSYECDSGQAGVTGYCGTLAGESLCMRECLNGFDCGREGYTCIVIDAMQSLNGCVPSCTDASCGTCGRCNHQTGLCESSTSTPRPGVDVGAACTRTGEDSECASGRCLLPRDSSGRATGFNGGYCIARCALPEGWNSSNLYPDPILPPGNCPSGSICFPNGDEISERSVGVCLRECRTSADCRQNEGYYCRKSFKLGAGRVTFENGYCEQIDCAQSGMHCPESYTCETRTIRSGSSSYTIGYCVPPA